MAKRSKATAARTVADTLLHPATLVEFREGCQTRRKLLYEAKRQLTEEGLRVPASLSVADYQVGLARRLQWAAQDVESLWLQMRFLPGTTAPPSMPRSPASIDEALAAVDMAVAWHDENRADPPATPGDVQPGNAKLSPRELADKYGVEGGALRKRLDRWRRGHLNGYFDASNAAKNEPKYLYDESAVMPVIDALRKKSVGRKRAADGLQKKI